MFQKKKSSSVRLEMRLLQRESTADEGSTSPKIDLTGLLTTTAGIPEGAGSFPQESVRKASIICRRESDVRPYLV